MALLNESVDSKKLDVRTVERNIARGVLTQDEMEKALKKLPDDSENAEWVNVETLVAEASNDSGHDHDRDMDNHHDCDHDHDHDHDDDSGYSGHSAQH